MFEKISKAREAERENGTLQDIGLLFYNDCLYYINSMQHQIAECDSHQKMEALQDELKNARILLEDLHELRFKKLVDMAILASRFQGEPKIRDPTITLHSEQCLYSKLVLSMWEYKTMLEPILSGAGAF